MAKLAMLIVFPTKKTNLDKLKNLICGFANASDSHAHPSPLASEGCLLAFGDRLSESGRHAATNHIQNR